MPIFIFPIISQYQSSYPIGTKNNSIHSGPAYRCNMWNMARIGFMASEEMSFENADNDDNGRTDDGCLPIL